MWLTLGDSGIGQSVGIGPGGFRGKVRIVSNDVSVTCAALSGFAKDLTDAGESLVSSTTKIAAELSLPAGTSGLLATVTPSLQNFRSLVSSLTTKNNDRIQQFGSNLNTTVQNFQQQDATWARAVASASSSLSLPSLSGPSTDVLRFSGMQSMNFTDVQTENLSLKTTVTAARDALSVFDSRLQQSIGIKPAEQYLTPLIGDWEILRTLGQRIRQLGTNDTIIASNLSSGSYWLTSQWSGEAASAYSRAMSTLHTAISERGTDMDTIAKTLEKGGECLERLVYNQAASVVSGLMEQLSMLGFTLPVAIWAQILTRPMSGSVKDRITAKVDAIRTQADSRSTSIQDLVDRIETTLKYESGTVVPQPAGDLFEVPSKVVADLGTLRYGFNDNVWLEHNLASIL